MTPPGHRGLVALGSALLKIEKVELHALFADSFQYVDIGSVSGDAHRVLTASTVRIDEAPSRARQLLRSGDTVFSTVRPYLEKIAYIEDDLHEAVASTGFSVLRPGPELVPRYLFFFSISSAMLDQVLPMQRGVSYPAVLDKDVRAVRISLPSLGEQLRVVELLEEQFSGLDESARALTRIEARVSALKASWAERLTAGLPLTRLSEVTEDAAYGTSTKCVVDGPGLPVVRIPNVVNGRIDLTDEKRVLDETIDVSGALLREGDLLIVRTNGSRSLIGRSAVVEGDIRAAFASYLIRYRLDPSRVRPGWAQFVLGLPRVRRELEARAASSAGQYNLSLGKLASLRLPMPMVAEQDRLLGEVRNALDTFERQRGMLQRQQVRTSALRRALLDDAFKGPSTGSASDLDRVDEFAS